MSEAKTIALYFVGESLLACLRDVSFGPLPYLLPLPFGF
jgi:hypothetical protein